MIKITRSIMKHIPPAVLQKLEGMAEINQDMFITEFRKKMKSPMLASLLQLVGLHYAYVGRWWVTLIFWLTCGGLGVWWLIDLFRIRGIVGDYNKSIAIDVFKSVQVLD